MGLRIRSCAQRLKKYVNLRSIVLLCINSQEWSACIYINNSEYIIISCIIIICIYIIITILKLNKCLLPLNPDMVRRCSQSRFGTCSSSQKESLHRSMVQHDAAAAAGHLWRLPLLFRYDPVLCQSFGSAERMENIGKMLMGNHV